MVRLALPSAVLKIAILGLMVFLRWKRSKGKLSGIPSLSPRFLTGYFFLLVPFFSFFCSLGPHLWHMEVPGGGGI